MGIWGWLLSRAQGAGPAALTVGKSQARIYSEGTTGVTFDDVAGVDEAKAKLQEIIDFVNTLLMTLRIHKQLPYPTNQIG